MYFKYTINVRMYFSYKIQLTFVNLTKYIKYILIMCFNYLYFNYYMYTTLYAFVFSMFNVIVIVTTVFKTVIFKHNYKDFVASQVDPKIALESTLSSKQANLI